MLAAFAAFFAFLSPSGAVRALADDRSFSDYYVYSDGQSPQSAQPDDQQAADAGGGGVYKYNDGPNKDDSRDDMLLDQAIAAKMNTDANGNPISLMVTGGSPERKEVALTFDDGPHPEYTSKILAILQHYRIRATFFMVGFQANKYPQWVRQVFQMGNEIGNHTYDHFRLTKLPPDEVSYQIKQTQEVIYQITGRYPRFIRPPGGRFDSSVLQEFAADKLAVGLWTYNTKDIDVKDPDAVYQGVMSNLHNGAIFLMHDGADSTAAALPRIIEGIESQGYKMVTLGEMVEHLQAGKAAEVPQSANYSYDEWKVRGQS